MAGRLTSAACVGRAAELTLLEDAFARLDSDGPQVAVVSGEAGIGKTRVIDELVDRLPEGPSPLVLRGGCVEVSRGELPYAPLVQALRSLVRQVDTAELLEILGPARSELARILPELGEAASDPSSRLGQTRLFELLLAAACRLSERHNLLLIQEDMHWSDPSTRDFLTFLVNSLNDEPIMLLCSFRSDEVGASHPLRPFIAGLMRTGAQRVELAGLSESDAADQLQAILSKAPPPGLARKIFKLSQGNPFFAEELAVAGDVALPPTLRELLLLRVASLSDPARRLLALIAIGGRPVEHSALQQLSGLDEFALNEALREAIDQYLIVPDGTCFGFRHALVREAVYSDLLPNEKAKLHGAFVTHLRANDQSPSATAELAFHCHMSGDLKEALPCSYRAAIASMKAYAFVEARNHFDRCLELWDQVDDPMALVGVDRVTLLDQTAECASLSGDIDRSVACTRAALELTDEEADPIRAGMLHERLGRYLWTAADGTGSLRAYREAVRMVPSDPPSKERARVLASEGQILMLVARYAEAIDLCEEAIAIGRGLGERSTEAHALCSLAPAKAFMGDLHAADLLLSARGIAEEIGDAQILGRSYVNHSTVLGLAGRPHEGLELAREGHEVARRWGIARSFGTWMKGEAAFHLLALGRITEADKLCREILHGDPAGYAGVTHLLLAQAAFDRGDFEVVEKQLTDAAAEAPAWNSLEYDVPLLVTTAELALQQGRFGDARDKVTEGLKLTAQTDDRYFTASLCSIGMRVEADRSVAARGPVRGDERDLDRDQVVERLSSELARAETLTLPPVMAQVASARAERARAVGDSDADQWAEVASLWDAVDQPLGSLYAGWREAEARLQDRDDGTRVRDLVRSARELAKDLDARLLQRQIEDLAARARVSFDDGETGGGADRSDELLTLGLTARELEVLLLVARGLSNKDIANELFISAKTASVHVSRILMKLGVASRVEATGVAYKLGLMEEPAPIDG